MKLNQLNYLIGKEDLPTAVYNLWDENPKVFSVLDILIALRAGDKKKAIDKNGRIRSIEDFFLTPEGVIEYIEARGWIRSLKTSKSQTLWTMCSVWRRGLIRMRGKTEADISWKIESLTCFVSKTFHSEEKSIRPNLKK